METKKVYKQDGGVMTIKTCEVTGKTVYSRNRIKIAVSVRMKTTGMRLRGYECNHCRGWHLTSSLAQRDVVEAEKAYRRDERRIRERKARKYHHDIE
jgi:hypothetical protein